VIVTARAGEAIRSQLLDLGLKRPQILLFYSNFDSSLRTIVNQDMEALNRHLRLGLHPLSLCTMQLWPNSKLGTMSSEDDYCRMMSLQLAAQRIVAKNVPGAIAEVGVYRGEFAAVLNQLFSDRTLYPATTEDLEESFALVSLDVDLYKPTVAGLDYFYPRLVKGGCIFIHDYNNRRYKGVRKAVDEFTEANGVPLVQLPDFAGTAVLSK